MSSPRRPAAAAALLLAALAAAVVGLGTTPTVSAQDVSLGWDGASSPAASAGPECCRREPRNVVSPRNANPERGSNVSYPGAAGPYKEDCGFWPEKLVYGFYTGESTVGQVRPCPRPSRVAPPLGQICG